MTQRIREFLRNRREDGPCVVVDTPGIANYRPGLLPFTKRRPVYPEDRIPEPRFAAEIFAPRRRSTAA